MLMHIYDDRLNYKSWKQNIGWNGRVEHGQSEVPEKNLNTLEKLKLVGVLLLEKNPVTQKK